MDGQSPPSTSPRDLYGAIGTGAAPLIFDVRRGAAFDADDRMLVGALHRAPDEVGQWLHEVPAGTSVVVYCAHGHAVSQEAAAALLGSGIDARYLEGGIAGWAELGLPMRNKRAAVAGKWVARESPKIEP